MSDFRWLIEAPGQRYLATRRLGIDEFYWTEDHNTALAFRSREQADGMMTAVRAMDRRINGFDKGLFAFEVNLGDAKAIEHGWMDQHWSTRPRGDSERAECAHNSQYTLTTPYGE